MQKLGKILMLLTIPWCLLLLAFAIAQSFEMVNAIGWGNHYRPFIYWCPWLDTVACGPYFIVGREAGYVNKKPAKNRLFTI